MNEEFVGFGKIARLNREIVVTEKIDGTNGCIYITEDKQFFVGSRTRWIQPINDNYGFAKWAYEHKDELIAELGVGRHFGEWWGQGINRNYGLKEKRFSLFNVHKWGDDNIRPKCCSVVPVLGVFDTFDNRFIKHCLEYLQLEGSHAAPGFMKPEGIVVYHTHGNVMFKVTLENDDKPKGK